MTEKMVIGGISPQKKRKNRFNLYDEAGEFVFSLSDETLLRFHLKVGMELSPERLEEIRGEDNYQYAKELAAAYLSYGPRTRSQLTRYLQDHQLDAAAVARAVALMEDYGYIDDASYAREFARQQGAKYGGRAIAYKLTQRGIDPSLAKKAMEEIPEEERRAAICRVIEQLKRKYAGLDEAKKRQRIYAAMLRKGFAYDDFASLLGEDWDGEG